MCRSERRVLAWADQTLALSVSTFEDAVFVRLPKLAEQLHTGEVSENSSRRKRRDGRYIYRYLHQSLQGINIAELHDASQHIPWKVLHVDVRTSISC